MEKRGGISEKRQKVQMKNTHEFEDEPNASLNHAASLAMVLEVIQDTATITLEPSTIDVCTLLKVQIAT